MSFETVASTVVVLAILVGLIAFLAFLKKKGKSFTFRVFTALGLGVVFGAGIQIVLGLGTDATKTALDWMSIVGQGYINLLKMLVMPLVFVAIVGAFTRAEVTDNLGKIGAVVLVVLLATVAIAAIVGWAVIAFSGWRAQALPMARWTRPSSQLFRTNRKPLPRSPFRRSCLVSFRRTYSPISQEAALRPPSRSSFSRQSWALHI